MTRKRIRSRGVLTAERDAEYQVQLDQNIEQQKRKSREAAKRRFVARALKNDGFSVSQIAWLTGVSETQTYRDLKL